jgi:hypothetical protein
VTSYLFLDVQGAFDNMSSTRLLRTMYALSCPGAVTSWCSSFVSQCTTVLSFNGQTDIQYPIQTRIPQGSPASPILFLIYLCTLFNTLQQAHLMLWMPSYIDDINLVTHGTTRKANGYTLQAAMRMACPWAANNAITFDDSKSKLLDFHHAHDDTHSTETNITLPNGTSVMPGMKEGRKDILRCIGIQFQCKLSLSHHVKLKLTATSRSFNALCSLVRHETSLSASAICSLYCICILSRSDFSTVIWWTRQKRLAHKLQLQQNATLR